MVKSLTIATALAIMAATSAAQTSAPVVVLVRVFATHERADELQQLYLKRLEYFRKAEPAATFRLHRSAKNPDTFVWYEVYPSQAAYEYHRKVVNEKFKQETGPTPAGILARPSESETLIELGR